MPANLMILPLLAGYWFVHNWHYTRFRSQRLDGYRLLLESALAGIIFILFGRVAAAFLQTSDRPLLVHAVSWWRKLAPVDVPFLGSATASLLIAIATPFVLNGLAGRFGYTKTVAQRHAIERSGNGLLRMLHRASHIERAVAITLDNRKVYIGTVAEAPNLEPHDRYARIIPFFSGYRSSDSLELFFTVDYLRHYDQDKDPSEWPDFSVVIPLDSIRTISFFDHAEYQKYFAATQNPADPGDDLKAQAAASNS